MKTKAAPDVTIPTKAELSVSRIKDCEAARSTYQIVRQHNGPRRKVMAQCRNQMEGGRPMDPDKLEQSGEAWRTNVNFRDAETAFNRMVIPFWKMVHDVPNKVATSLQLQSPHVDEWNKAFNECFDLFLEDWGADYFANFTLISHDYIKFGPAYAMWCDDDSPRFEHARTENVLLPKRAKANVSKWDLMCVESEISVADLYDQIREGKSDKSEYVGWNPDMIKKLILKAQAGSTEVKKLSDWTEMQDRITSNDLAVSEASGQIDIVKMFVRNLDGSIAYYLFTSDGSADDFIFKNENYAKSMTETIRGLFFDVGVGGKVHTIKGFGIKNYPFSQLQNRLKSRLMDAGMFATSMNFQQQDDTPNEAPPVQHFGAVNIFPRGLTQLTAYPNIATAASVVELLANNQAETNYIYRDAQKQIADTQTARQAVILANLAEEVGSATASIYLAQVSDIFAECMRRLVKKGSTDEDAVLFIQRLKDRGVTDAALQLIQSEDPKKRVRISVKTGANPGTAGAALRDAIMKELLGMAHLPGMNLPAIRNAYLANKLGTQAVRQFTLPDGEDSMPAERREAMLENMAFGQGQPLPVDPGDAHFEHADEHLKPLEVIIQQFQQMHKITHERIIALQIGLPHIQQHATLLEQDQTMKPQFKAIWARLSNVQSVTKGIIATLQKEAQQQQQMQQDPNAAPDMQQGQPQQPMGNVVPMQAAPGLN